MTSHDLSNSILYPSPAIHFKTLHVFLVDFPKFQNDGEKGLLVLNVAFVLEIIGIISRVHHALFLTMPGS